MSIDFAKNNLLHDYRLKEERLAPEFSIVSNATPALKQENVDVPTVMYIRAQGQTAAADAIESGLSWTTPVDNSSGNSVFGVLMTQLGSIKRVKEIVVTEQTSLATSFTVTKLGVNGLTPGGNIAFEINGTGLNLAS